VLRAVCVILRRATAAGGVAARGQGLGVVVCALVDDLRDAAVGEGALDLLLHGAIAVGALVVAPRVLAPLHLLLPVLPPIVSVLKLLLVAAFVAHLYRFLLLLLLLLLLHNEAKGAAVLPAELILLRGV